MITENKKQGWLLQPCWERLQLEKSCISCGKGSHPDPQSGAGLWGSLSQHQHPTPVWGIPLVWGVPNQHSAWLKDRADPAGAESFPVPVCSGSFPQSLLPWTVAPLKAKNALLQGFLRLFWLNTTQGYLLTFMHTVIFNIKNILIAPAGLFCTL